jgi:hypothetical protein
MDIITIFYASFGTCLGSCVLWRLSCFVDTHTKGVILSFIRKWLCYTLVTKRQNGSSNTSVFSAICILLYLILIVVTCTLNISTRVDVAKRCSTLFVLNAIPLYLGGRTNLIADRFFSITLNQYGLVHRWVGRICVVLGVVHGVINSSFGKPTKLEILVCYVHVYQILH